MCGWRSPATISISRRNRSAPESGAQLGAKHLHRHLPVVPHVLGEVHDRHAPLAQLSLDAIAVGERRAESGVDLGHGEEGDGPKLPRSSPPG
jgi:hypothetical protein